MVFLGQGIVSMGSKVEPILGFEVRFETPFGMAATREEAAAVCQDKGLDADGCIRPVVVARSATMEEIMR